MLINNQYNDGFDNAINKRYSYILDKTINNKHNWRLGNKNQ